MMKSSTVVRSNMGLLGELPPPVVEHTGGGARSDSPRRPTEAGRALGNGAS